MTHRDPTSPSHADLNPADRDRLDELQAAEAIASLAPDEQAELDELVARHPAAEQAQSSLSQVCALLCLAEARPEAVPRSLREKLHRAAERFASQTASPQDGGGPVSTAVTADSSSLKRGAGVLGFVGGAVIGAAAAAVLLALLLRPAPAPSPATPAEAFEQFVSDSPDEVRYPWAQHESGYEQVTGWAVWSESKQAGYLVLGGLPANDPSQRQYQLWIVDPDRDEFPVDGGVFDVQAHLEADGKAYIPIDAKLPVRDPKAFALTLEQPGGVVKSNNPLLVVAPAG